MIGQGAGPDGRRLSPRQALLAVFIVGLVARICCAFDDGIFWPDEIYQSFEPAHWLLYGSGMLPWEFIQGARNWSVPGVIAGLMKVSALLGLDDAPGYIRFVKIVLALSSTAVALGIFRLVNVFANSRSDWPAFAAASLWLLASPIIYLAPRAFSENFSVLPLVWGLVLLFAEERPANRTLALAGVLLGLSVIFRLLSLPVVGSALLALLLLRRWHSFKVSLLALMAMAVLAGALDALSWHNLPEVRIGGWFHTYIYYLRFNFYGGAVRWGVSPWWYFLEYLALAMPTVGIVLLLGVVDNLRRGAWVLPLLLIPFFVLHFVSPHKEARFILPGLMLACASAGVAISYLQSQRAIVIASAVTCCLALLSCAHLPWLRMHEMQAHLTRPDVSAWDFMGDANRLLLLAGRQPDLCGLRFDLDLTAWSGGSTYLHRSVPIYASHVPADGRHFNYVIGALDEGSGELVGREHGAGLYRLFAGPCVADPGYQWKLQ